MKKQVLITGSCGFIGSHLVNFFVSKNFDVSGWDVHNYCNDSVTREINMMKYEQVLLELKETNPDLIIHCAGNANVNESVKNPQDDYDKNVVVTKNMLNALKELDIRPRLVFLSSAAVYGNKSILPIVEEAEKDPLSPYAKDKLICEELCLKMIKENSFDIKIARIFSVYGVGLKKQIFWDMNCKIKKYGKLEMFGTGNESRDYINIKDLLNAIYLLANTESKYNVFNVANGEEYKIKDVANIYAKINNIEEVTFNNVDLEGNPLNWKADISKLESIGYKKRVDLKDGLTEYSNWARTQNI